MKKLKVGIAGYGVVGKRRRKCIEGNPNLTLTAVCDRTFETEGVFQDGIYKYKDYKNLLHQELDILIVCLTNDIAPEVTIAGIEKGLHVFCEKPPGKSVADVKLVMDAEKLFPRCKLMYGFNHRYHNSVKEALKIKEIELQVGLKALAQFKKNIEEEKIQRSDKILSLKELLAIITVLALLCFMPNIIN